MCTHLHNYAFTHTHVTVRHVEGLLSGYPISVWGSPGGQTGGGVPSSAMARDADADRDLAVSVYT